MRQSDHAHASPQRLGVLIAHTPVRLLEVSRTGCLLECDRQLEEGLTGEFRVEVEGQILSEELRITRCQRLEGSGSTYRLGAEFLRTRPPGVSSLRGALHKALDVSGFGVGPVLGLGGSTRL
jgi:hypothetical protein